MITDPKSLETFFAQYMPGMKQVIEDYWAQDRKEVVAFLSECLMTGMGDSWMREYFFSMLSHAKTAPHEFTNPWEVL